MNGKPGRKSIVVIAYEPDDLYSVWLVEGHAGRKADSMVRACVREVYCDTLQTVIELTYDRAIAEHNEGFIPVG